MTEKHKPRRRSWTALGLLISLGMLAACDGDTPTAPERAGAVPTMTAIPTVTPTPLPGPLAVVEFALAPAHSGYRHAFTVRFDVREARGIPISVTPNGVWSPASYAFPQNESRSQDYQVGAFGSVTFEILVEHNEDIPCSAGLFVGVHIAADDGLSANFEKEFNCTTGYWPL